MIGWIQAQSCDYIETMKFSCELDNWLIITWILVKFIIIMTNVAYCIISVDYLISFLEISIKSKSFIFQVFVALTLIFAPRKKKIEHKKKHLFPFFLFSLSLFFFPSSFTSIQL